MFSNLLPETFFWMRLLNDKVAIIFLMKVFTLGYVRCLFLFCFRKLALSIEMIPYIMALSFVENQIS